MAGDVRISPMIVEPVALEGMLVRLEPLGEQHLADLTQAAADVATWRWMPEQHVTGEQMQIWLDAALSVAGASQLSFATVERSSGHAVGSTRYLAIERTHRRLEIGWTWLAPTVRGRGYNDEAKLLQLQHAFEVLGCQRVEFKTDARNERSRAALTGIGARYEGTFRKHMVNHGRTIRDSAWYSVLDDDWPAVRQHLERRVSAHIWCEGG